MAVAIVLGALAGAAGFAPLFAGLRMTRRVTDTSNLGQMCIRDRGMEDERHAKLLEGWARAVKRTMSDALSS